MPIRTFLVAISLLFPSVASSVAQDQLPAAKEIIARSVEQQGGKKAFEKVDNYTIRGKIELPGIKGDLEIRFEAPRKVAVVVELENLGVQRQGMNGDVAWEIPPGQPARLMQKDEASRFLQEMNMSMAYKPETIFKTMKTIGMEMVGGTKCYKVELTRDGVEEKEYGFFALDSGLPVKYITTRPTAIGPLKVETTIKKYKEFDGMKSPVQMEQNLVTFGMLQNVSIESVEHNKKIPEDVFAIPDEVRELVKNSSKK